MHILKRLHVKRFWLTVIFFAFVLCGNTQVIATFPLKSGGGSVTPNGAALASATNANVKTDTATLGSEMTNNPNGTFNSTGVRIRPTSLAWPTSTSDNFSLTVSVSPKTGFDYVLTSVTFKDSAHDNSPNLYCQLAYQANNSGNWTFIGTPQICTNLFGTTTIGGLNESFYSGNIYKFRFYFYGNGANDKNQGFRMIRLVFNGNIITPPALTPTVLTGALGTATKYANTVTGSSYTISNAGVVVKPVNKSGVCFSTAATPTFANGSTTDIATNGVATATFNSSIAGLAPNTTYYVRAYAITQVDTVYAANILSFTTQPQSVPSLNTNPVTSILSNKATAGGKNIDSGGYKVLEKGVLYSTLNSNLIFPATAQTKSTSDGVGSSDYSTVIKPLNPNTKYYIKAYARNSLGVGYGNVDSFTTLAPVPSITVTPASLDFGEVTYNANAPILSYRVNASYLNPTGGAITLTSTNSNYTICATLNGSYVPSINIPYSSGTITNKIIYVKSISNVYGNLSGMVLHTGGGTVAPNADTTFLKTSVVQNLDTLSNAGSDFWCGFGYQAKMKQKAGNAGEAKMSIYVATGNVPATAHVELTSGGYSQTFTIPANSVHEFTNFPTGDAGDEYNANSLPDARLYYTGRSKRSIHIYSDNGVPVSAFMHTYTTSNTAAGAMLFPSNTWNSSYTVQAVGGKINSSDAENSFFFVVAKDDNTQITFTPKNDVLDSNTNTLFKTNSQPADVRYKKDSTYTITLQKGEVFNAMGFIQGSGSDVSLGLDLSGTTIKTSCDKKIAVFGGNGRCYVSPLPSCPTGGSDHMIQQMFPSVAWGTKYLTMPTRGGGINYYRIYIQNPTLYGATNVWVNNPTHTTPLTGLVNNLYYEYNSSQPLLIESDKPINVSEFMTTPYCTTPNVDGGPEMIILSPVQQAITSATVYSAAGKDGNANQTNVAGTTGNHASFINVIVPTAAVASFKLDNSNLVDTGSAIGTGCPSGNTSPCPSLFAKGTKINVSAAFRKHPQDTSYSIGSFWVQAPLTHTISASKGFNAIAYGMGAGESYGYNAGTTINNLSAIKFSLNPYGADTTTTSVKTCVGNQVTLQIALPYDTSTVNSIIWDPGNDASLYTPTGPQAGAINPNTLRPLCLGTIVRDGRTFYIYKSPVQYTYSQEGAYKVKVSINGTFANDCGGTDVQYVNVIVGHDDISFTATPGACGAVNANIVDNSSPLAGTSIVKWIWDFGDNTKDTVNAGAINNPTVNPHLYPSPITYTIKLTTINSVGCFSVGIDSVNLASLYTSTFTQSQDTICPGGSVSFTPTSSSNAAKWFWDFGETPTVIDSSNTAANTVSHIYTKEGTYIVKHYIKTGAGCPSTTVQDTVIVVHKPIADFILPSGVCLPGSTTFINISDTATAPATMPYTYHWDFGVATATDDTSNLKNPAYTYPNAALPSGGYPVTLTATNRFGCTKDTIKNVVNVFQKPKANILSTSDKKVCESSDAHFYDGSTANNQTINKWYWSFNSGTGTSNLKDAIYKYTTNKLDTVTLYVETQEGCRSDTAKWVIKVNPKPVAKDSLPSSCIGAAGSLFKDKSTIAPDDSTQIPFTYTWNFGDPASGASNSSTSQDAIHNYASAGNYIINHSVTTLNGCTDTKVDTFKIAGSKPVPLHFIPNPNLVTPITYCSNQIITLRDSSTVAIGSIKKMEIFWDDQLLAYGGTLSNPVTIDNSPQNGIMPVTTKVYSYKYPYSIISKNPVIRVVNYNDNNCFSDTTYTIRIATPPVVKFDTIRSICVNGTPKKINFAYDSTGFCDAFNYVRLVSKPTYSGIGVYNDSMFNPAIADTGLHYIKCVYETRIPIYNHCKDSAYAPIRVWALPKPAFTTTSPLCEGSTVTFTDKSTSGAGTGIIKKWSWNFGDPSSGTSDTSSSKNPQHTFSAYSTYNVTLTATSDSGCSATLTPPKALLIHPKPKVDFIPPAGFCPNAAPTFTDKTTIADNSEIYFTHLWNFGDPASGANNFATGKPLPNPSHQYGVAGVTDSIRLTVISKDGCIDSMVKAPTSLKSLPVITPSYKINGVVWDTLNTKQVCLGTSLHFTPSFKANVYLWTFADTIGLMSKDSSINHTYPAAKVYNGSFAMIDSNGCQTKSVPLNVEAMALPIVVIKASDTTCQKNVVTFTNQSIPATGSTIQSVVWNFGDPSSGGANTSTSDPVATHIYSNVNTYNVTLKVTSSTGCVGTSIVPTPVTIHPLPKVNFGLPTRVCLKNELAEFNDSSTISDGSEAQFTHTWNFGDPVSGAANVATGKPLTKAYHDYATSANYYVKLIVESKDHCFDSSLPKLLSANVLHPKTHPDFTVNTPFKLTPRACEGTAITFKDSSGTGITKSYWVWGDVFPAALFIGNTQSYYDIVPAGSYNGYHFVDDKFNCRSDTINFFTTIDPYPIAGPNLPQYILAGHSALLNPNTSGGTRFLWTPIVPVGLRNSFLDDSTQENPLCTPILDSVVYKLEVWNDGGCKASPDGSYTVKILHTPVVPNAFSPNGDGINDLWDITSLQYYTGANVQVFNRYGQVVLNRFGYVKPWDGTDLSGKPLPVGVYYYIIKPGLGLPLMTGSITILK